MRVCFQPERRTPTAVPGQIIGSAGTSVWHAKSKPTTHTPSISSKTTTNGTHSQLAPGYQTPASTRDTRDQFVYPIDLNLDSSIRISENFDYERSSHPPQLTIGGHFQHFRDSEELYDPSSFRTEWLVWPQMWCFKSCFGQRTTLFSEQEHSIYNWYI